MNKQGLFYLVSGLAALLIVGYGNIAKSSLAKNLNRQTADNQQQQIEQMKAYLTQQSDPRKMVRLTFRLSSSASKEIVQLVADKAYELKPDSRDIVLLDSIFHPELKDKIIELDPLYQLN